MLSKGEMYLLKKIQEVPGIVSSSLYDSTEWNMSKANLYAFLQKLELQELITFTTINTGRFGTPQRRYALTEKGKIVVPIALQLEKALKA